MIAYIVGDITFIDPTYTIVECNGIGYRINISLNTFNKINNAKQIKLLTYLHVKEDAHTLYGFAEESEKQIFTSLITISGIGPNSAKNILSSISPDELHRAVTTENVSVLEAVKGIGAKSARRIVLELKDKLDKEITGVGRVPDNQSNKVKREALSALIMLGYNKSAAEQAVSKAVSSNSEELSIEELVKLSLKSI